VASVCTGTETAGMVGDIIHVEEDEKKVSWKI
jgi:hypothetical protein